MATPCESASFGSASPFAAAKAPLRQRLANLLCSVQRHRLQRLAAQRLTAQRLCRTLCESASFGSASPFAAFSGPVVDRQSNFAATPCESASFSSASPFAAFSGPVVDPWCAFAATPCESASFGSSSPFAAFGGPVIDRYSAFAATPRIHLVSFSVIFFWFFSYT